MTCGAVLGTIFGTSFGTNFGTSPVWNMFWDNWKWKLCLIYLKESMQIHMNHI